MRLILEHVSHAYGETAALDEVSLEIAEGEIIALIGPSGCGKSTLLGIAGGLLQPSAGRVRSEEHTSELQYQKISYAVFCLKKKKSTNGRTPKWPPKKNMGGEGTTQTRV